ncbi:MAG TPA: hypothetical protein VJI75_00670 [Candidatus Nanoarchaeia archaeon]|nr:hypothetical protein [Candidatus Nanoarchaeia archaeon]
MRRMKDLYRSSEGAGREDAEEGGGSGAVKRNQNNRIRYSTCLINTHFD